MKFAKLFPFLTMILFASLIMTSCSEEDSVTTTEQEEEIRTETTYQINNRTVTFDAHANYCMDNGKELLVISNTKSLLTGVPFNIQDLKINDYVIQLVHDPDNLVSFILTGSVFGDDLGFGTQQNLFTSETDLVIKSNDGSVVVGVVQGEFLGFDDDNEPFLFPFSINFAAEIVQSSDFCD